VDNEFHFELQLERDGHEAAVKVFGDFDMIGVLKLETELSRLTHDERLEELLLDLGGVTFIDSTALGLIIDLDRRARQGEFDLSLVPGPRHVQRVFEVTQLADTLPFRSSEPD
jgi:anti-anti-sigma factor